LSQGQRMREAWKVGALARQTGLSVRTLHYYDEIGLLCPSQHTEAGHRLYNSKDIARLQQIKSLRQLGFSLDEIRECLKRPAFSVAGVVQLHLQRLREQIEVQHKLYGRLETIAQWLERQEQVPVAEFLKVIEVMSMLEKYYSPEQMEELKARRATVGEARIKEVEAEWPRLMAQVQAEMDKGTDPADERVQELARRWRGLVNEFTGGNPGIEQSLRTMYEQESNVSGMDTAAMRPMMEYMQRAWAASGG